MESNSHPLARISVKKIFHEVDVHHVWKVGSKQFWAPEAEMSLTAIQLAQVGENKIFHQLDVYHV